MVERLSQRGPECPPWCARHEETDDPLCWLHTAVLVDVPGLSARLDQVWFYADGRVQSGPVELVLENEDGKFLELDPGLSLVAGLRCMVEGLALL